MTYMNSQELAVTQIFSLMDHSSAQTCGVWSWGIKGENVLQVSKYVTLFLRKTNIDSSKLPVALLYLKKIQGKVPINSSTWYRLTITAIVVASKMMDDSCLRIQDFARCAVSISPEILVLLEQKFLEMLEFNAIPVFKSEAKELTESEYSLFDSADAELREVF